MNATVSEGDVFWLPRYFPFCQISSRTSTFEFFGFTTWASKNHPQFLVGKNSLLQRMRGPEFATAFGVTEDQLNRLVDAQRESTILPTASVGPPDHEKMHMQEEEEMGKMLPKMVKNFGIDMIMGFD